MQRIKHQKNDDFKRFSQFRLGLIIFGMGMSVTLIAGHQTNITVKHEVAVALGLMVTALGFLITIQAYLYMLIQRFSLFLEKE